MPRRIPIAGYWFNVRPPVNEPAALHFALVAEMAKRQGLSKLSMGMSHDFAEAIRFGATAIRIGTAIFWRAHSHLTSA